jgi:hypothetical protein
LKSLQKSYDRVPDKELVPQVMNFLNEMIATGFIGILEE